MIRAMLGAGRESASKERGVGFVMMKRARVGMVATVVGGLLLASLGATAAAASEDDGDVLAALAVTAQTVAVIPSIVPHNELRSHPDAGAPQSAHPVGDYASDDSVARSERRGEA